ncbi:MAG: ATP-binding cassette domain-containing protein [Solirubrobacteraceae bacterium]
MSAGALPVEPEAPVPARAPVLEVRGVTKSFGALSVLRGIDIALRQGEVLGLVGDNGAGKSTLVKILSGFHPPDGGEIFIEGQRVSFNSVEAARSSGIETVYQDLALIPQLPVYQNLFLGHEVTILGPLRLLDKRAMRKLARQYLDDINVNVPSVDAEAADLSGGQRQAVAVARSVRAATKILLLDEPLAAMGARESRLIIDLVKDLASSGRVSIIVIDHNYAHLFELCDRLNVIDGGRVTLDQQVHETSIEELTELMVSSYRRQLEGVKNAGA